MTARAAALGGPEVRPRIVTRRLKPNGTPIARSALRIGLNSRTWKGGRAAGWRAAPAARSVMSCSLIADGVSQGGPAARARRDRSPATARSASHDREIQLLQAIRVGEDVDLHDPSAPDGQRDDRERRPVGRPGNAARNAVDQDAGGRL